ncbi:MAG: hypothetical protein ABSE56_12170 [Bryobacteraceae bacterium]|jgi:hypothetical protein
MSFTKHAGAASHSAGGPSESEIREQLRRILDSRAFRGSRRCIAFLEYAVEKTLAGQADLLKERNLAVDVFERAPDTNLMEDTIVRVGAREVRKRLAQYYTSPEASRDAVVIDLPAGSYVPEFRHVHGEHPGAVVAAEPEHRLGARPRPHPWIWGIAAVAILAVAGLAILLLRSSPEQAAFREFWRPLLGEGDRVLLAVAHPLVYHPSLRATRKSEERLPPETLPLQRPIQLPPNEVDGSDMIPVPDQYVGFGDLTVSTDLASFLARQGKTLRVRLASKVEFADFKDAPAILIGAYTNRWSLQFTHGLRFRFTLTADGLQYVQDAMDPKRRFELAAQSADGSSQEDFVVITRLVPASGGKSMLIVGGLKQFGTEAGGRLLVNPQELGSLLRKLPPDWSRKQLQVVLRASVIGNSPAAPELVAWHTW